MSPSPEAARADRPPTAEAPAPVPVTSPPACLRSIGLVIQKDAVLEWRSRARVNATIFFAIMTLLLFSFAVGPHQSLLVRNAPGFLWLAIFLSSTMSLGESMRLESENDATGRPAPLARRPAVNLPRQGHRQHASSSSGCRS